MLILIDRQRRPDARISKSGTPTSFFVSVRIGAVAGHIWHVVNRNKHILYGLDHRAYEHPFDRKALMDLESIPGLETVAKFITKNTIEKYYTIQCTGSNLKVTKATYPRIYEYLEYACQILDMRFVPDLYIQWGYDINAYTVGAERPIIVLNSGLIDLCDENEILFIIGHECGHIKSNHMLYHMMAQLINQIINQIPLGRYASFPLQYALFYWSRMSEFTSDRAGWLCCQNLNAVVRAFVKMAGLPISEYKNIDAKAFVLQASNFQMLDYENLNKVIKLLSIADSSHPWTVMRGAELIRWINSGDGKNVVMAHTKALPRNI